MENSVVIIKAMRNIHADNDFFVCIIYNEVNFPLRIGAVGSISYNANINGISPTQKFVVDDVFHNVAGIILAVIQSGVTKANIRIVVFVRILEIGLSFHIVALRHGNKERVDDVLHIVRNQCGILYTIR